MGPRRFAHRPRLVGIGLGQAWFGLDRECTWVGPRLDRNQTGKRWLGFGPDNADIGLRFAFIGLGLGRTGLVLDWIWIGSRLDWIWIGPLVVQVRELEHAFPAFAFHKGAHFFLLASCVPWCFAVH